VTYEVEQKYRVTDLAAVAGRLDELNARWEEAVEQVDTYFSHPARDFGQTDEALRIRQIGDANRVTYKGPKLDATTKTRREIEISFAPGEAAAADYRHMLTALGFQPVAEVRKSRRSARVDWRDRQLEIALDQVDHVGTFVELELIADEADLDAARWAVASLAQRLGLTDPQRRTYLELVLEAEQRGCSD